jgi:pyruvate,water dikinase
MRMKWPSLFGRRPVPPGVDVWRLQALFSNFRRILDLNNAALAHMAEMEQALGGEYIFDRPFLENSVRRISSLVHHCVYCLNALTGNAYVDLYDRYQDILALLDAILAGGHDGFSQDPVLALDDIGWELEPLVGIEAVCLAELGRHAGVAVAPGFVLTAGGVDALLGRQGADNPVTAREDVEQALARALGGLPRGRGELRIVGVRAGEESAEPGGDGPGDAFSMTLDRPEMNSDIAGDTAAEARALAGRIAREAAAVPQTLAVLVLMLSPGVVRGTVRTRAHDAPDLLAVTARERGAQTGDTFLLRRVHPFEPVRSEITPKPAGQRFAGGLRATDPISRGLDRGSALAGPAVLMSLAETAMALERMIGSPVEARWGETQDGACVISRVRPLPALPDAPTGQDLAGELAGAEVLARGGQLVQSGVAAGRAVLVREDMEPADFPLGAVAVARTASPRLSPVLRMASAVVTEYGTAAGHLATVARELRLPAIFGLAGVTRAVAAGQDVTVDAGEGVVYAGVLDALLRHAAAGGDLYPTDPEYRTLRRLLRFLMPLHLVDPQSPMFTALGCRTMHDILHYCHDRAVEELAHFQERRPGVGSLRARRMRLAVPMDMRVLDIGGGVAPGEGELSSAGDVRSVPLAIFLRGLERPEAWSSEAADLRVGDIMASLPRTMGMLESAPASATDTLALAGADYLNLSLRTGYHFSVVDALLGEDGSRNYVYFRFAGGLTAGKRRERRARFLARVLEVMDFMVSRDGDLVVGRLKLVEEESMHAALETLGALTAYCRQLDTAMRDDADVDRVFADFSAAFMPAFFPSASVAAEGRP